jgi:glyoxylase-like metal-dependent hydrolase (beta-lactamase superfamily II)
MAEDGTAVAKLLMSEIQRYETSNGHTIYAFAVPAFTNLIANIHVVVAGDDLVLIDAGSGLPESNQALAAGIAAIGEHYDRRVSFANLTTILLTHGHIDHYGGLPYVRQFTAAPAGIHILDCRVVSTHEERVVVAAGRLASFLALAGVPAERRQELMRVYLWGKSFYRSTPVDFSLDEGAPAPAGFEVFHVPGHCPGQVCLRLDDVLFTADHVLARTTPHQAPESITNHMGLDHYFQSLDRIAGLADIRMGLGGHEDPIRDVNGRITAIRRVHQERLERVLASCRQPRSIADVSKVLFGHVESYHVLLALEEAGAHVEYLYQRGELVAANLAEIEREQQPEIRYVTL